MAVISIYYNESSNKKDIIKGYVSVEISYNDCGKTKVKEFNSGDFVKDWYDCNKFIIMKLSETESHFSNSSTVDHFIMSGAPFRSAYLKVDPIPRLSYEYDDNGTEFFVKKGTKPTWKQLRELCGDMSNTTKHAKVY